MDLKDPELHEARAWLAATTHPVPLAMNAFDDAAGPRALVERLYAEGAPLVLVESCWYDGTAGAPYADQLVVQLPAGAAEQVPVQAVIVAACPDEHETTRGYHPWNAARVRGLEQIDQSATHARVWFD